MNHPHPQPLSFLKYNLQVNREVVHKNYKNSEGNDQCFWADAAAPNQLCIRGKLTEHNLAEIKTEP